MFNSVAGEMLMDMSMEGRQPIGEKTFFSKLLALVELSVLIILV